MSCTMIFENDLIGLDKTSTINAYYARDINMNINNSQNIVHSLKKLGFCEIDMITEEHLYVKNKVICWIKSSAYLNLVNTNLSDIISEIRNSNDFRQFKDHLIRRIRRTEELNIHINDADTYNFYSRLTLEELNHLGY